jgi:heme oxygenase
MTNLRQESLMQNLRAVTRETHERLDQSIMAAAAFETLAGYGRFATVQYLFHRDIDALYDAPALAALLPDLAGRRRLGLIAADLRDLGLALPEDDAPPAFTTHTPVDIPAALGWLYVAEGSNLGAAVLRKEAAKLGLSDTHGARHLAPAPEGPAAKWRSFTDALEAVELTDAERRRATMGAQSAFTRVQSLVDERFA